jgi:hypothetical protein
MYVEGDVNSGVSEQDQITISSLVLTWIKHLVLLNTLTFFTS